MYTVVIAEKEHIDAFQEYAVYLEPFRKKDQFALCMWNAGASGSLHDLVPELETLVDHRDEWRVLILCDERGLAKRNPFNVIEYQEPSWEESKEESITDYYDRRRVTKELALKQAAEEPLVRLVTFLCEDPVLTRKGEAFCEEIPEMENADLFLDVTETTREHLEYVEYRRIAQLKQKLRDGIRSGEQKRQFCSPMEVLCVAKRHNVKMDRRLESAWGNHDEREYSRFYDWNLYFDKMRYLIYDIVDKEQFGYRSEYIRFLTMVSLIASNPMPSGCMNPHRVYRLECEVNLQNMAVMLERYFAKLSATRETILEKINEIHQTEKKTVMDNQAVRSFCQDVTIPVNIEEQFNASTLLARIKIGLSSDCPVDNEEKVWISSYSGNRKALKKLLKQPQRALKRAVSTFKQLNVMNEDPDVSLTEFQVEDVEAHIGQKELDMIDTSTNSIYDLQRFYDRMEESQRHVRSEINRRMKKRTAILFGVFVLLAIVIGVIPVFIMNQGAFSRMLILMRMTGVSLLSVGIAGIVCLIVQRLYLRSEIREYNGTMRAIRGEVEGDALQYSVYLSHACNFMRATSALTNYKEHMDGDYHKIRILQKHVADIDMNRAETEDIFGEFLHHDGEQPVFDETPYDYNFSCETDYAYPIQPMPDMEERITFLQKGSTVDIPYGTIREMVLRREELYD